MNSEELDDQIASDLDETKAKGSGAVILGAGVAMIKTLKLVWKNLWSLVLKGQ